MTVAAATALAALPGLLVLQALPRALDTSESPQATAALGALAALLPLAGAFLGGRLVAVWAGRGWRASALVGMSAQLPAVPGLLTVLAGSLEQGYAVDALVYAGLFLSYLILSGYLGANAAVRRAASRPTGVSGRGPLAYPPSVGSRAGLALLIAALGLITLAVLVVSTPAAPLSYAVFQGLAAALLCLTVTRESSLQWLRPAALSLLVLSLGVTGLSLALLAGLA
ncbi:MAG: hypothetical protein HYY02_03365 [Chloroflexi bacterium]|nr:hypothetical protein [Chloroflexota bacterium]